MNPCHFYDIPFDFEKDPCFLCKTQRKHESFSKTGVYMTCQALQLDYKVKALFTIHFCMPSPPKCWVSYKFHVLLQGDLFSLGLLAKQGSVI